MKPSRRLLWLGLTYPPAIGGAARYAGLMAKALDDHRLVDFSLFLVARHPNEPLRIALTNGISEVRRVFGYRAAKATISPRSYLAFALDNFGILQIGGIARRASVDTIIVHGWYLLHPSVLRMALPLWKRAGFRLVADIRDCYLGEERLHQLDVFDKIICCGERVMNFICVRECLRRKAYCVPVPMESTIVEAISATNIIDKLGLKPKKYIFSPNGVDDKKRFPLLFDAWSRLLEMGEVFDLVISGRSRDWRREYDVVDSRGRIVFLGSLDQSDMAQLYLHCAIAVNVSNNESFGRVPLEAMALEVPMLFPSGVPEFSAFPRIHITQDDPVGVANQISSIVAGNLVIRDYDISRHNVQVIAERTIDVIYGDGPESRV